MTSGSFKCKIHLVTFLYIFLLVEEFHSELCHFKCKIHLVTFLYIFLLVDCFKWALIDCKIHWWHFFISSYYLTVSNGCSLTALKSKEFTLCSGSFKCKIHLVTFLYIFLLVDCFKWALIDCKIHLVTFLYIFLLVDCFKWALIDCIEKRRVHSELWPVSNWWVYCKIHLVTFLYIFLLVDCFKWALIDCIEKWRVHSELCQFQPRGYIVRFTWWHFFISSY